MQDQLEIVTLKNKSRVGKAYRVLVEDYDGYADLLQGQDIYGRPRDRRHGLSPPIRIRRNATLPRSR